MAPPDKKQKTEESKEEKTAEQTEDKTAEAVSEVPAVFVENESDASPVKESAQIKDPVVVHVHDTTLNVVPSSNNIFTTMTEGGIHHFIAGFKGNTGVLKGRYMFEVKLIEFLQVDQGSHNGAKNVIRIGFSTESSHLVAGSTTDTIAFDNMGGMWYNKGRTNLGQKADRDSVLAVVLNRVSGSENCDTVSYFIDGKRVGKPVPLPEVFKGKALFPAVALKNATVHVNFGPQPLSPLPFTCNMIQAAAKTDVSVKALPAKKDKEDRCQAILPVGLPDEGCFDWADKFLEENPTFSEVSDRMILEWAEKSDIWRGKGYAHKVSHDKPGTNFQVRELDDESVRKAIFSVVSVCPRDLLIMELKSNLIQEERKKLLDRLDGSKFNRTAAVVLGQPPKDFQKRIQAMILKKKQELATRKFEIQKLEKKRKKAMLLKQKEREAAKKKEEAEKKAKAKAAAAEKAKAEKADGKEGEATKEDKEEEPEDEVEEVAEAEEMDVEASDEETEPPKVVLDDDEKKMMFRKSDIPDITLSVLSSTFSSYSLPKKDEGFDTISYEWNKEATAADYLKKWILGKKLSIRVDDIQPSKESVEQAKLWQSEANKWQSALRQYQAAKNKKKITPTITKAKVATKTAESEKDKDGEKEEEKPTEEKETEEKPMEVDAQAEPEVKEPEPELASVDVFGVQDVSNVGGGLPLFAEFEADDWTLLTLRMELHHLVHSFRKDVDDDERPGITLDHLPFYYERYFKKTLSPLQFGFKTMSELIELINDTIHVDDKSVVSSLIDPLLETHAVFLKLTEESRRHRKLQVALGVESAKLNLVRRGSAHNQGGNQQSWRQQNQRWQGQQNQWQQNGGQQAGWKQQNRQYGGGNRQRNWGGQSWQW